MSTRSKSKSSPKISTSSQPVTASISDSRSYETDAPRQDIPSVIAFTNQKGGVGKSTTAIHALHWFTRRKHTALLVDADGQQSSSPWAKVMNLPFIVMSDPEILFEQLPQLAQQYDVVIVDGPGNASEITKAILNRADLALIPAKESFLDVHSTGRILQFIQQSQELRGGFPRAALFFSDVDERTVLYQEARAALAARKIKLLSSAIHHRTVIKDASGQGTTVFGMKGRAATAAKNNYDKLFAEALEVYSNG